MGLLDFLWSDPKEGAVYKSYSKVRRKSVGQKVYVVLSAREQSVGISIDGKMYGGSFSVSKGVCIIRLSMLMSGKTTNICMTTPPSNVKFSKSVNTTTETGGNQYGQQFNYPVKKVEYTATVLDKKKLKRQEPDNVRLRRRGTALVDTPKGILVVSGKGKLFILPGGGPKKGESRQNAAIRELKEETGLEGDRPKYLFSIEGGTNRDYSGGYFKNDHKVFLLKAKGKLKPDGHEVKFIHYWKPGSRLELGRTTKLIIDRYLEEFK